MEQFSISTIDAVCDSLNTCDQTFPFEKKRELCIYCNRSIKACFCGFVKTFDTRTRFVLLMHDREFKQQKTGTGRMTRRALVNSEIIMGVDFTEDQRVNQLLSDDRYFPVLLFPGKDSIHIDKSTPLVIPESKMLLIFLVDATWRLAKKIMYLSRNLQTLPRISFTPQSLSRFRIKRQPAEHCVSTIEAVYNLLHILEKTGYECLDEKHETLLDAIDSLVSFQERFMPKVP